MRLASRARWKGEVVLDKLRIRDIMVNLLHLPSDGSTEFTNALGDGFGNVATKSDLEVAQAQLSEQIWRAALILGAIVVAVGAVLVAIGIAILASI